MRAYVADNDNHRIEKFDSDGNFITEWGFEGTEDGGFKSPQGVAVDSSGNVYVADTYNDPYGYNNDRIQSSITIALSKQVGALLVPEMANLMVHTALLSILRITCTYPIGVAVSKYLLHLRLLNN